MHNNNLKGLLVQYHTSNIVLHHTKKRDLHTRFIEQLKNSIEQKESLEWSTESSGFIADDILRIEGYRASTGRFYISFNWDHRQLFSFTTDEEDPTLLNLRESKELLKWLRGENNGLH